MANLLAYGLNLTWSGTSVYMAEQQTFKHDSNFESLNDSFLCFECFYLCEQSNNGRDDASAHRAPVQHLFHVATLERRCVILLVSWHDPVQSQSIPQILSTRSCEAQLRSFLPYKHAATQCTSQVLLGLFPINVSHFAFDLFS